MGGGPIIPFFTDQNVPESVGDYLMSMKHDVTRLRHVMSPESSDPVIAVACSRSGHVLITHDTDFRETARRLRITQRQYRTSLHKIQMRCPEPRSAKRIAEALPVIEREWINLADDRPMVIEIGNEYIRINR